MKYFFLVLISFAFICCQSIICDYNNKYGQCSILYKETLEVPLEVTCCNCFCMPNNIIKNSIVFFFLSKMSGEEEEDYDFPKTLRDFGYHFNKDGQLRDLQTDKGFNFVEKEDNHRYNQKRYEAIGDIITEHVYQLLEEEGLDRVVIPVDAEEGEPTSFFFQSKDAQTNTDKLLILIHGSGPVKAGQWARRLIMNDCLDSGTQLPYIKWAIKNGYGVIVANTNINYVKENGSRTPIRGSRSPEKHTVYLWEKFVQPAQAKNIAIVAHSYGGVCTLNLVDSYIDEFEKRVFAIAFTDSVHSFRHQEAGEAVIKFFEERAVNWASAYDKLDTKLTVRMDPTPTVSAGTDKHEYTSFSSMFSIFKYLTRKYSEFTGTPLPEGYDVEEAVEAKEEIKEDNKDETKQQNSKFKNEDKMTHEDGECDKPMSKDVEKQPMSQDISDSQGTSKDTPMSQDVIEESQMSQDVKEESQMSQDAQTTDSTVKSEL